MVAVVCFVVGFVVDVVVGLVVDFVVSFVVVDVVSVVLVIVVDVVVVVSSVVFVVSVSVSVVVVVVNVLSKEVAMLVSEDSLISGLPPFIINLQPLNAVSATLTIRHAANILILVAFVFTSSLVIILTFYLTSNHSLDFFNSPVLNNKHCKINVCVCYRGGFILSGNSP